MSQPTHTCPGGCGQANIPHGRLACPADWKRLPVELRTAIWEAYRQRAANPAAHRAAVADAIDWYQRNPR